MIDSILTVCTGNICRSPFAEAVLDRRLPEIRVDSAGIAAMSGWGADETASRVAAELGYDLEGHVARQIGGGDMRDYDLILAMDAGHLHWLREHSPQARGKIYLLGHWDGETEITDPYQRDEAHFREVFERIRDYCGNWTRRLGDKH